MPPHLFYIGDKLWRVRYGDPNGQLFSGKYRLIFDNRGEPDGHMGWTNFKHRTILLHPTLRLKKHRIHLWETFAHELLHAMDWKLRHPIICRLEGPLASWMLINEFSLRLPEVAGEKDKLGAVVAGSAARIAGLRKDVRLRKPASNR